MTWVDLVVLGILAVSALLSCMRGVVHEVLGIGAWVGAVAVAVKTLPWSRELAHHWVPDEAWLDPAGFVVTFLLTLIILALIARLLGRTVRGSALGGIDRSLGLVFGLARGAVLVILAYILGGMAMAVEQWPEPVLQARALAPAYEGASWLARQLPPEYRPHVYPPPAGRKTTAEALLRAAPHGTPQGTSQGRATGASDRRER